MKMILKARTAYGLGGKEFYTEVIEVPNTPMRIEQAKRQFAVKFGVDLDRIEVIKND